ncbi:MAG: hypothetical protein GC154_19835 [bacterium]|nr:hypothetical protein [bacterium]
MESDVQTRNVRVLRLFLRIYALVSLAAALTYFPFLADLFDPAAALSISSVRPVQWIAVFVFVLSVSIDFFLPRNVILRRALTSGAALNVMVAVSAVVLPVTVLELSLRPFARFTYRDVRVFQQDDSLQWALRRNYNGKYGGVAVSTNSLGLRGPEFEPQPDKPRILFIGDSVVFGLRLPYEDSIPAAASREFESGGVPAECVNAGVPGYSSIQVARYFVNRGVELNPDVVVWGFVLNDVLPAYTATRFGDFGKDNPIPYIRRTLLGFIENNSAVAYFVRKAYFQLRFGRTLRESAVYAELMDVKTLVNKPEKEEIQAAWRVTEGFIKQIAGACRERGARFLLLILPHRFQLEDPENQNAPQRELLDIARRLDVESLDLLPPMARRMRDRDETTWDYFYDNCHLTAAGSDWAGERVAQDIGARGWLRESQVPPHSSR